MLGVWRRGVAHARARGFTTYTMRVPHTDVDVDVRADGIALRAPSSGLAHAFHFDYVWLRDACRDAASVHPSSQQKLFHTSDIPLVSEDAGETLVRWVGSAASFSPQWRPAGGAV